MWRAASGRRVCEVFLVHPWVINANLGFIQTCFLMFGNSHRNGMKWYPPTQTYRPTCFCSWVNMNFCNHWFLSSPAGSATRSPSAATRLAPSRQSFGAAGPEYLLDAAARNCASRCSLRATPRQIDSGWSTKYDGVKHPKMLIFNRET